MRRTMQLATAALTGTALFLGHAAPASADAVDTYPQAMRGFAPVIHGWIDEVADTAAAAQAKPEILAGDALRDLAARGRSIAGDLAGTEAPATYAAAHANLIAAVESLVAAAEAAPHADPRAFAAAVDATAPEAKRHLRHIQSYALRGGRGRIELPDLPASGN